MTFGNFKSLALETPHSNSSILGSLTIFQFNANLNTKPAKGKVSLNWRVAEMTRLRNSIMLILLTLDVAIRTNAYRMDHWNETDAFWAGDGLSMARLFSLGGQALRPIEVPHWHVLVVRDN